MSKTVERIVEGALSTQEDVNEIRLFMCVEVGVSEKRIREKDYRERESKYEKIEIAST